ncbi:MAG: beta-lactamase family protein, partial [Pseudomonadota bacterium]|nr:beta-lactamase family protein [Pseudomonadota bacterium]
LAHTSGLPGLGPDDAQPACLNDLAGITLEACVAQIATAPLVSTPGLVFNYGAADYQVAGYIATRIADQGWQAFFDSRIGQPLGLGTFTFGDPATVTNPRVAGSGTSDVADYVKILQMVLNDGAAGGASVLSARSVRALETNQIAGRSVQYSPADSNLYPGYTFGFFISDASLHPGSAGPEFSAPGLFGALPWIDEDLGYGAVLLIDSNETTGQAMWNAVRPQIIAALTAS